MYAQLRCALWKMYFALTSTYTFIPTATDQNRLGKGSVYSGHKQIVKTANDDLGHIHQSFRLMNR